MRILSKPLLNPNHLKGTRKELKTLNYNMKTSIKFGAVIRTLSRKKLWLMTMTILQTSYLIVSKNLAETFKQVYFNFRDSYQLYVKISLFWCSFKYSFSDILKHRTKFIVFIFFYTYFIFIYIFHLKII